MIICIHHYTALINLYVIQTLEDIPFRSRKWNSPNGLTHDFNQELEVIKLFSFLGKTGLGKVFGNVQAFLDYKISIFEWLPNWNFSKGLTHEMGKQNIDGLLVYRGDISILFLPTGHYYAGSRGPFSKYFGTSCEFWSEQFKRAKVVHTWVSVVGRELPSPLLPLKKVCVVGIQKRRGKLRARDGGKQGG